MLADQRIGKVPVMRYGEASDGTAPSNQRQAYLRVTLLAGWSILSVLLAALPPVVAAEPPSEWKAILAEDAQTVWDSCFEQQHFHATRLLAIYRQLGSQHDGDRQYEVARLFAHVDHDPKEGLLHYLRSPDPYDRAFAIQVILHLRDRRFISRLKELSTDTAELRHWDVLGHRDVGEAARRALDRIENGANDLPLRTPPPKWLISAQSNLGK